MADTKITALADIGANPINVATFPIPMVDLLDNSMAASGTTKKVTVNQILQAGGTATLASATITGDLTVRTNKLAVTSTGVGVNYTTPAVALHVGTTGATNKFCINTAVTNAGDIQLRRGAFIGFSNAADNTNSEYLFANGGALEMGIAGSTAMTLNSSGNLGIGVTPSAWATYKAVSVGGIGASVFGLGSSQAGIAQGAYFDNGSGSGWAYSATSQVPTHYLQINGENRWNIAASGTAGAQIASWTQAMTLDASGNLLVGKTAASVTTVGFQTLANGEASVAMAASTGASTTLNVWSTGAAAYRFYVGMNGTISATNTTISAISDARLKENVQDIDVGLGAILALKPRKFDWKAGKGKDIKGDRGFIAQEFEQVFPNLIDEWKDPAPEGEAPYKSVRQDLIPVLVKAIQELAARVQTLETR